MEVEYALLADAAQVVEGKLYVLGGGFDRIWSTQFPVTHPAMSFVVKLRLHVTECNRQHGLEVQLWDSDGNRLADMGGTFSVEPPRDDPTRASYAQMLFNIVGQQFPRPGAYAFYVIVNGEHKKTVPLYVEESKPSTKNRNS